MNPRVCDVDDCDQAHYARGLCRRHYEQAQRVPPSDAPQGPPPLVVICPDDMHSLVAELVELDARPIFRLLWRAVGEWHLAGLIEKESA